MKNELRTRMAAFLCCSLMIVSVANAENPRKSNNVKVEPVTVINHESVNNFIADRVNFKKEMALKELSTINSIALNTELDEEDRLFPADELYGSSWENRWVDPFQGDFKAVFPDSCNIDCSSFILPIIGFTKVTSKFGPRRRRMHKGIDLKVQVGDTIRAAFDGRVRIVSYERRGYGKYMVIRHPNGLETVYGHLSAYIAGVNDYVRAGDIIGLGGNTGRSTGSHLHFETRFLGQPINPAEIIDFENGVPHEDLFVFRNKKKNGRNTNIYTTPGSQMAYHRIKSGDTLGEIARKYGTTIKRLCQLNGLTPTSTLRLGQAVRCSEERETVEVKSESQAKRVVAQKSVQEKAVAQVKANPEKKVEAQVTSSEESGAIYHRIKEGDTLGAIATKYNTTVAKLKEWNNISDPKRLKLGRSLRCS